MTRRLYSLTCCVAVCFLTVFASSVRAETVLFDGDFLPADWTDFIQTIDDPLVEPAH